MIDKERVQVFKDAGDVTGIYDLTGGKERGEMMDELRNALRKDFHRLYVREFTNDWKDERIFRDIEIGIMSLESTMAVLEKMKK